MATYPDETGRRASGAAETRRTGGGMAWGHGGQRSRSTGSWEGQSGRTAGPSWSIGSQSWISFCTYGKATEAFENFALGYNSSFQTTGSYQEHPTRLAGSSTSYCLIRVPGSLGMLRSGTSGD